jgi:hypothetical protein
LDQCGRCSLASSQRERASHSPTLQIRLPLTDPFCPAADGNYGYGDYGYGYGEDAMAMRAPDGAALVRHIVVVATIQPTAS